MTCFHCGRTITGPGELLNADGDFVCDGACKRAYQTEMNAFLTTTVHSAAATTLWLTASVPEIRHEVLQYDY